MNKTILLCIILVEGFVSIATEIITIRQLSTVAGSSVVITSFVIGIFLLALAYGYKRGGSYTVGFNHILQKNFILASILLGIGLSSIFISWFFASITALFTSNTIYSLIAYLLLIIAPLAYILGQTIPITMNLFNRESASAIGSKVLHLSTLGSFLGSVLTTIVFMNYFGVAWTIITNCTLLIIAAVMIAPDNLRKLQPILVLAVFSTSIYLFNIYKENTGQVFSNAYSNYHIIEPYTSIDGRLGKLLAINNSASSFAEHGSNNGFEYVEKIKQILFSDLKISNHNILVLGAGGFSISAAGDYGNNFTYIDIDPDLANIIQQRFLTNINGKFINADARVYLRTNTNKYQVIISDTFSSETAIPAHLVTKEYLNLMYNSLDNHGIAILNVILNPTLQDLYSQRMDNTIRSVFSSCMAEPLTYTNKMNNVLYICHKHHNLAKNSIYTDNRNPSALDYAMLAD